MLGLLSLLLVPPAALSPEPGFVSLSDDAGLSAWRLPKPGAWECVEGVIRRGSGGTLFTRQLYEDFVLRLEFKIGDGANSGVYLRAPLSGRQSALGMEIQVQGDYGRPASAESCGAIYAARAPNVAANRPESEWNELEVDLRGSKLRVTMNGPVIHDLSLDDSTVSANLPAGLKLSERSTRGFIALQDHGSPVQFRNVRLRPEPEQGFEPLFDGTLKGWTPSADAAFAIADGVLTCTAPAQGEASLGCARRLGDYELRLEYRAEPGTQALWLVRTDNDPKHNPLDVVISDDAQAPGLNATGALSGNASTMCRGALPAGEWNDLRIVARGRLIDCYLNAMPVLRGANTNLWGRYAQAPLKGTPGIVVRKGNVEMRNVRVKGLP